MPKYLNIICFVFACTVVVNVSTELNYASSVLDTSKRFSKWTEVGCVS